jgi:SAM-dependent methyltransferase
MPALEQNARLWNSDHEWTESGEQWSGPWGSARSQWFFSILPRIHRFLPAGTILEIAPGYGRWTEFLKDHAGKLIVVDLMERCIQACRQRFAAQKNIEYHVNDGKSLAMIPDGSVDFVFSFDSLVHAEADVLGAYLEQLSKKLKADGAGFIHHSNAGEYRSAFRMFNRIQRPWMLRKALKQMGLIESDEWRAHTMTATLFAKQCEAAGLQCITQELIPWKGRRLIDTLSVFARKDSKRARPRTVLVNRRLQDEARNARALSRLYCED